ncbi:MULTISPECIES: hypothetical protein [Paenibacillus]|nr:hypothetical protein [Paenibacillus amylolyticus]
MKAARAWGKVTLVAVMWVGMEAWFGRVALTKLRNLIRGKYRLVEI